MQPLSHAKVITQHGPRDFDAHFDGEYIGSFRSRPEAQTALDDHALRLAEDGLIDTPLAAAGLTCLGCGYVLAEGRGGHCDACVEWADPGDTVPDTNPDVDSTPGTYGPMPGARCATCGGEGDCPDCDTLEPRWAAAKARGAARMAARRDAPNPGRAIARHWHKDPRSFLGVLRQLDPVAWWPLAESYSGWRGCSTQQTLDTWMLAVQGTNVPANARAA